MSKSNPWEALSLAPESRLSARRVDATHPLGLFWARDAQGAFALLVRDVPVPGAESLPRLKGLTISAYPAVGELRLSLDSKSEWELFSTLCEDLVESSRSAHNPAEGVDQILQRLHRWQRLMARDRRGVLTEAEIRGLVGELTFLNDELLPRYGAQSVAFWNGPAGAPQDFAVGPICFEVKSRSMANVEVVRISSAEQLWPPCGELFLVTYIVTAAPTEERGRTLLHLVDEIRRKLSYDPACAEFENRLADVGYIDRSEYGLVSYFVDAPDLFKVVDGFPRIVKQSIPVGISNVTYDLALQPCRPFQAMVEWPDTTER